MTTNIKFDKEPRLILTTSTPGGTEVDVYITYKGTINIHLKGESKPILIDGKPPKSGLADTDDPQTIIVGKSDQKPIILDDKPRQDYPDADQGDQEDARMTVCFTYRDFDTIYEAIKDVRQKFEDYVCSTPIDCVKFDYRDYLPKAEFSYAENEYISDEDYTTIRAPKDERVLEMLIDSHNKTAMTLIYGQYAIESDMYVFPYSFFEDLIYEFKLKIEVEDLCRIRRMKKKDYLSYEIKLKIEVEEYPKEERAK